MKKRKKICSIVVYNQLMKYKSFRESTPTDRHYKLTRAIQRRRK